MTEILEDFAGQTLLLACNHTLSGAEKILTHLLPSSVTCVSANKPQNVMIEDVLTRLKSGRSVAFFPEGQLSPDGAIHRGSLDLGWLVLTARVPVIPVAIVPSLDEESEYDWELKIGEPLDFSHYWSSKPLGQELDNVLIRAVSDDVMAALVRVSGLEYHDLPASSHKPAKISLITRFKQGTEPALAAERARIKTRVERREQELADIESADAELDSPLN